MQWYILQTKPNAHMLASEHLKRQGYNIFIPFMIKTYKKAGKFENKKVPLFPSYIFMGTELNEIQWKSVNSTRGVSKAISFGGRYLPVENEIIQNIKCRCDESSILTPLNDFVTGDSVKIERGPFTDFICSVDKIADKDRIWVFIDILQHKIRTKVTSGDLSKIAI